MIKTENFIQWYEPGHFESETRAWDVETILGTLTTNGKTKVFETIGGGRWTILKFANLHRANVGV